MLRRADVSVIALLVTLALAAPASGAGVWIAPDLADREPTFSPGSLFWKTNEYPTCPVLFRTVLEVGQQPMEYAGFRLRTSSFVYVFLNGRQIAGRNAPEEGAAAEPFDVEFTHLLRPGRNVFAISAPADGLALDGGIAYAEGQVQRFATDTKQWKAQKRPPLTMLEYEPCMQPDFDDRGWFSVREVPGERVEVSDQDLRDLCEHLAAERLSRLDEDGRWRLQMLAQKGIAVVDWEGHGWAGAQRLPDWVRRTAASGEPAGETRPGSHHEKAEALTRYVRLADQQTNLRNHVAALAALKAPDRDITACREAAEQLEPILTQMRAAIEAGKPEEAVALAHEGEAVVAEAHQARLINDLCCCLDNKFGWFDTTAILDSDPERWGIRLGPEVETLSSPLSPAALLTVPGDELVIEGWTEQEPLRVYNKPPVLGPVCAWAVLGGDVASLKPGDDGIVYDQATHGNLSENWIVLVEDMARGGRLPIQLVFLQNPKAVAFETSDEGTGQVSVTLSGADQQLFVLRPLKEWRGFLAEARTMTADPLTGADAEPYITQCRLWSRALLNYPITFSEAFIPDPDDRWALNVADVYNYIELEDEWGTQPLRLAPLPPLATYGLMVDYRGLKVISDAPVLGSWGVWGDHIAAVSTDHIVYHVPLDPIKRFGGFTSYCFGPTDIGGPGSRTELATVKRTGANSYRPQHNQTGQRAMDTLQWCAEQGLQNVFNTDEKWVPDVCEHYRKLAEQCKEYPPDAVAYDLLNEPETRDPRAYNALIRKTTKIIREIDKTHLIYVEVIPPWGPGAQPYPQGAFESLDSTGDDLTVYSFHDYEYRLPPRWPNDEHDVRDIVERWIPAFRFSIDNRCPIHLGEFGGFEQTKQSVYDNPCALTLMTDYLRVFDQFGWHWHYYANRGVVRVRQDGSLQESYVQEACRRYFARGTFNVHREP